MALNPLEDDPNRDQRIRERAYALWEADGSPHGGDLEFWERARELVAMEESAGSGQLQVPDIDSLAVVVGQPVEEASIQENLGEFPDRLSDQGEHPQYPSRNNVQTP